MSSPIVVIPAKAGIQTVRTVLSVDARFEFAAPGLGPRLRGDDIESEQP